MQMILAVALGGALGAVGRYLVMGQAGHWFGSFLDGNFPYGTLTVNVVGSFIMGVLIEVFALVWSPPMAVQAFFTVGCLGAFTTFSAFSMETILMMERGETLQALLYALLSVSLSVLAFFLGLLLFRNVLT